MRDTEYYEKIHLVANMGSAGSEQPAHSSSLIKAIAAT